MTFLIDVDHQIFFFLNALAQTMVGDFFALVTWWGDGRICIPVMTFVAWRHRGDLARTEWQRLFLFSAVLALMVVLLKTGLAGLAVFDSLKVISTGVICCRRGLFLLVIQPPHYGPIYSPAGSKLRPRYDIPF